MANSLHTVEAWLSRLNEGGTTKQAEAHTEAGSIGGETTHPVKNVDDHTETATEGARSKENVADVKEEQGKASVDSTPEATAKSGFDIGRFAKTNPFTAGTRAAIKKAEGAVSSPGSAADDAEPSELKPVPTGENVPKTKAGKEDPGSTHEARTDNSALDGMKYAADADPIKMASDIAALGEQLLLQIGSSDDNSFQTQKTASANGQVQNNGQAVSPQTVMQMGWEMAGLAGNGFQDKQAVDNMVRNGLIQIQLHASQQAEKVAHFLDNYFGGIAEAEKQAAGEMPPMDLSGGAGGGGMGGAGGMPPGGAAPGGDPSGGAGGGSAMLSAMGGGEAGGAPPGGAGGGGAGGGGAGGGDQKVEEAMQLLDQLGVDHEQLLQALMAESGGGEGGGEGGAMGGESSSPMAGGDAGGGGMGGAEGSAPPKTGSDNRAKPQAKTAGVKQGNTRQQMRDIVTELLARSRT